MSKIFFRPRASGKEEGTPRQSRNSCGSPRASTPFPSDTLTLGNFFFWLESATNGETGNINWLERARRNLLCSSSSASATEVSRAAPPADLFLFIGFDSVALFKSSPLQVNEKSVQQCSHSSRNYMKKLENEGRFMAKTPARCCSVSTH